MRLTIGQLAEKIVATGVRSRKIRIYRKETGKWEAIVSEENATTSKEADKQSPAENGGGGGGSTGIDYRENEMKIQMLSAPLYEQVFRNTVPRTSQNDAINRFTINQSIIHSSKGKIILLMTFSLSSVADINRRCVRMASKLAKHLRWPMSM